MTQQESAKAARASDLDKDLQMKLNWSLRKATKEGRMEEAMTEAQKVAESKRATEAAEAVKMSVRQAFVNASKDGSIEKAMGEAMTQQESAKAARASSKEKLSVLAKSSLEGTLPVKLQTSQTIDSPEVLPATTSPVRLETSQPSTPLCTKPSDKLGSTQSTHATDSDLLSPLRQDALSALSW